MTVRSRESRFIDGDAVDSFGHPRVSATFPRKTVGVAFSGGVDSAISVCLLREQGYDVEAWHMLTRSAEPAQEVMRLAEALEVPLHAVDLREAFECEVIAPFYEAYAQGVTPNPCMCCNPRLKFGLLRRAIGGLMATGHYVGKEVEAQSGALTLRCADDAAKDQSYFLYALTPEDLRGTLFPLAGKSRAEVVVLARQRALPIPEARLTSGSQDICFLSGGDYRSELQRRHPEVCRPGDILNMEGRIVGRHSGLANYTRGQRRGLGVATGDRAFVVAFDRLRNTLTLGPHEALLTKVFQVGAMNWLVPPSFPLRCEAVSRYHHRPFACTVSVSGQVVADEPQALVTQGQACVFYRGPWVLGGGVIL